MDVKYRVCKHVDFRVFRNNMIDLISHCGATPNKRSKMMQQLANFEKNTIEVNIDNDEYHNTIDTILEGRK